MAAKITIIKNIQHIFGIVKYFCVKIVTSDQSLFKLFKGHQEIDLKSKMAAKIQNGRRKITTIREM